MTIFDLHVPRAFRESTIAISSPTVEFPAFFFSPSFVALRRFRSLLRLQLRVVTSSASGEGPSGVEYTEDGPRTERTRALMVYDTPTFDLPLVL